MSDHVNTYDQAGVIGYRVPWPDIVRLQCYNMGIVTPYGINITWCYDVLCTIYMQGAF